MWLSDTAIAGVCGCHDVSVTMNDVYREELYCRVHPQLGTFLHLAYCSRHTVSLLRVPSPLFSTPCLASPCPVLSSLLRSDYPP